MLTPGPHSLTYKRGNHVFGSNVIGTPDALSSIPIGGTAAITFVNPPAACMTAPEH